MRNMEFSYYSFTIEPWEVLKPAGTIDRYVLGSELMIINFPQEIGTLFDMVHAVILSREYHDRLNVVLD